ncbi:TolC family protein [Sphingomonas sp.]|uniref:TolC family protein n=1 Tax=Sphingomonas sp. TaxID=28214 RepID=UPI003CC5056A
MKRGTLAPSLALSLTLGGCATYAPLPLDRQAADRPVDLTVVLREAAAVRRPYLTPVTIDLSQPLDGNAIATLAVVNNPDLKAQRARAGVSTAQAFAARLLPDPTLTLGVSPVLSGPDQFLDLVAGLGLDLAQLRSRGVRVAQAEAQARQVRLDLAWAEWQTAGQARIRATRIQGLGRSAALAQATLASARSLFERTQRAVGRGDLGGDTAQAARTAFADAEDKARVATRDLGAARGELAALLGLPIIAVQLAPAPVTDLPLDPDRLVGLALANRTDLQALEAGYAAQEAAVRKAILDQFPTLALNVNANRDTAGNLIVGPTVDFTLPLWNRNRGGIAVERATRAALKAEYEARLAQTRAEIAAAVSGIAVARRQREAVLRDLPSARRFALASRRAADRGDLARSAAETAGQALRDRETTLAQAEQDIAEQMIALELLTGTLREAWTR